MTDETPNDADVYDGLGWLRESGYDEAFIASLRAKCEQVAASADAPPAERAFAARVAANLRGEAGLSHDDAETLRRSAVIGGVIQSNPEGGTGSPELN
jgi:hypothetical protein